MSTDGRLVIERESGIDLALLREWFATQDLGPCRVEVTPLEARRLSASVTLPRNLLHMEGPAPQLRELYRRFELQFLSAGG